MNMRRLRALFIKEFFQIIRDPSSILISVVLPLILMIIYGFGVSLDLEHVRIGLVLEDTSPTAMSFATSLKNSRYFDVQIAHDRRAFDLAIESGGVRGIVIVPSYFSSFRDRNEEAPIQVIADASEANTANFVQNYVRSAWLNWLEQEVIASKLSGLPLVRSQPRFWYNEELLSRNFLIPGSLAIIMTLIGTLLTALVMAREYERGTLESQMATPVTIQELLIGKLIPYYVLGMFSMILCFVFTHIVYDVPFRGSYLILALVTSVFLFAALGLGLLVSVISRNQVVASQLALVLGFLPAFMLSGFIFEIASMPIVIQLFTYILPARYFVSCLQTLFLAGNVWPLLIKNIAIMIFIGLILHTITARITIKRLD